MPSSNRQTVGFLMNRFRQAGIHLETRYGQNFLIDLNLVHLLADSAQIGENDVVLEVGTGTGSLTAIMAAKAASVVTVEISPPLYQLASEELIDCDNVIMLQQDALKNKNNLHAKVLEAVAEQVNAVPGRQFKLVANLPYNIATPIIANLLLTEIVPVSMTVTIQKELADRMHARPSTKDYSALSVWIQSQCRAEIVRVMAPTVFWPRPKVHSAIIHIEPDAEKRAAIPDLFFFHRFVRSIFQHRRKFLRSVLLAAFKDQLGKPEIDAIMSERNLGPDSRAEQLEVDEMLALCESARQAVKRREMASD